MYNEHTVNITNNDFAEKVQNSIIKELVHVSTHKILSEASAEYLSHLFSLNHMLKDMTPLQPGQEDAYSNFEAEIRGAQKYLDRYNSKKGDEYLKMAKDELGHARKFLKEMQENEPGGSRLANALMRYNKLEAELA
ncbi:MAG: hypothetical protein FWC92_07080 [Defluviitaleaceae bacterium]|nr:hypothetical protein [Defluviitaleaceae bacterium]